MRNQNLRAYIVLDCVSLNMATFLNGGATINNKTSQQRSSTQEITAHEMLNMEWVNESRWLRCSYSTDAINSNNLVPNHVSEISIEDTVNPVASTIHSDK